MKQFSFDWWIELGIATGFGMAATGVSGNITVGLIVAYALFVLADLREYAKARSRK